MWIVYECTKKIKKYYLITLEKRIKYKYSNNTIDAGASELFESTLEIAISRKTCW